MDLTLPIIGVLSYIGYCFNKDGKNPRNKEKKRNDVSPHSLPSGENIYHSEYTVEVDAKEKQLMAEQYEKSKDPVNTNIIPQNFNDSKIFKGPMFNPKTLSNELYKNKGVLPSKQFTENFSNVSELSGVPMVKTHNNMVPFFGSTVKQNTKIDSNASVLENFTGSLGMSTDASNRQIVGGIFTPHKQGVYGTELMTNKVDSSRFNTSISRNGVSPITSVKTGYTDALEIRPLPKDISELRVNQKEVYSTPVIRGSAYIKSRAVNPELTKHRPETTFELGPERFFTTIGTCTAPKARSEFVSDALNKKGLSEVQYNLNHGSAYTKSKPRIVSDTEAGELIDSKLSNLKKECLSYKQDNFRNAKSIYGTNYIHEQFEPPKTTHKEGNLFSYSGIASSEVSAHRDYSAEYNNTRQTNHHYIPYYSGIAGNGSGMFNRTQFENCTIKTNREAIDDTKGYMAGGQHSNVSLGASGVNMRLKEEIQNNQIYGNIDKTYSTPASRTQIGLSGMKMNEKSIEDRLDSVLMTGYAENPYTHFC